MSYRNLAILLLRCSGLISIVMGVFSTASYVPMIWDVATEGRHATGAAGVVRAAILPSLSVVVGGLVLFLLAGALGRLASRDLE